MDINLQNKKIKLIQWLSTLNDETIIEKIMKLRETEGTDWWKEISKEEKSLLNKELKMRIREN